MITEIKDVEQYIAFPKYKTRSELLEFLNEELELTEIEFKTKWAKKLPDFRKVKKNDMHYGECMNSINLLRDMIGWIKDLEDIK
jgi:hypothetical protein